MKGVRPRTISSALQDALGLLLHRKYGSKSLIWLMNNLGFCSSYADIQTFELSTIAHPMDTLTDDTFVQFIFDNADFNIATIDGHNTFHCMGGIKAITPGCQLQSSGEIVKLKRKPNASELGAKHMVPVEHYEHRQPGLHNIVISDFTSILPSSEELKKMESSDVLWLLAKWLHLPQIPGWKAFMIAANATMRCEKSEVVPLSFVKAPPSDYDTINTVIKMALEQCESVNQKSCFITFDQPLYIKAREIVASPTPGLDMSQVVVRLGGFHMLMSFLGSIGEIMAGSGLRELLCTVYAPHSVEKMLQGHAYARAVRAHFLVQTSLAHLVFDRMDVTEDQQKNIKCLLSSFLTESLTISNMNEKPEVQQLASAFSQEINKILQNGPTAALWVQYFRLVSLIKRFIDAERSGKWDQHLECVAQMIPIFHASGHTLYAKSSHIYLQDMLQLPKKIPKEDYDKFVGEGYFTIRRTDSFWSGTWSDMLIEQTLMRSFKSVGGLTRGRSITDSTLTKFIQGTVSTHKICQSLEEFAGLNFASAEQHVDFRDSRIARDSSDVQKLIEWLKVHPPFAENSEIMSIATGVVGNETVNCYKAIQVGEACLTKLTGKTFGDVKLARKDKVISLSSMTSAVKVKNTDISVDPLLIYQRIAIIKENDEDLADCFNYELSPYPMSLFDDFCMRKTTKSSFYSVFTPSDDEMDLLQYTVVIDGGFLLHRVKWSDNTTYAGIQEQYISYIKRHYGSNSTIVFDGYDDVSSRTKIAEQSRRARLKHAVDVKVEDNLPVTLKQDVFLTNASNKARLIAALIPKLQHSGIEALRGDGDADSLVVTTAIQKAAESDQVVLVVGEDVDLLVLLVGLTPVHTLIHFFKPGKLKVPSKLFSSNQLQPSFLREAVLFLHAFSGCDTTSATYGHGKMKIVKAVEKNPHLLEISRLFYSPTSTPEVLSKGAEKMFLALYGAPTEMTSINAYRHVWFQRSARKIRPDVASFPPTKGAVVQHALRVYHQIQLWLGNSLDPIKWGWKEVSSALEPVPTMDPVAPDSILNMIFCSCKTGCGPKCGCRRSGVSCSMACSQCNGVCLNRSVKNEEELSDDELDG